MRVRYLLPMLSLAAACNTDHATATSTRIDRAAVLAKGGGGGTDSRVQWYLARTLSDGITAAKLYGDGLNLDGTPVADPTTDPSAYDGEAQCSARGTINWYSNPSRASGNMFLAPGGGATPLCFDLDRLIMVDTGAVDLVAVHWTTTIPEVMQLAAGESVTEDFEYYPNNIIPNCARVIWRVSTGSGVVLKRLSGDANRNPGEWTIETRGTHVGTCLTWSPPPGKSHLVDGEAYYLPFSLRAVEVLR